MIIRGRVLHFLKQPDLLQPESSYEYIEEGALAIEEGRILEVGKFLDIRRRYIDFKVVDYKENLIFPGFIDLHNHFPQVQVIASYGTQLLEWLNKYTFPEEAKFCDERYAKQKAKEFIKLLLSNGTTTSVSFCSVHKHSADVLFEEASRQNMCILAGKVMMDRNAPENLIDDPFSSYQDTKDLIVRWHKTGRNYYVISPRFAITSSPEQLSQAGKLMAEHPSCYLQTHLAENEAEIKFTMSLYPSAKNYLDIYQKFGLVDSKSLMGHSIHLDQNEISVLRELNAIAVHCPTSNMFLGSGFFPMEKLIKSGVKVGIATDVGGGTSYSMINTLDASYKIQQFLNFSLNPFYSFYWATLGNAKALGLEKEIGSFKKGCFADIVVMNAGNDLVSKTRMRTCKSLAEELFVLQTLGGIHSIKAVYIAGESPK